MCINASCYSKCGCDRQVSLQKVCESFLSCRVDQLSVCYKLLWKMSIELYSVGLKAINKDQVTCLQPQ